MTSMNTLITLCAAYYIVPHWNTSEIRHTRADSQSHFMISSCIDLACPFSCCYTGTQSRSCMEATVWFSSTLPFAKFVEGILLPFTPAHSSNVPTLHKICGENATVFHPCTYYKCPKSLQNLWRECYCLSPLCIFQMSQTFPKFVEGIYCLSPLHVFQMSQHMASSTINTSLAQFLADTASIHYTPHMWEPCPWGCLSLNMHQSYTGLRG